MAFAKVIKYEGDNTTFVWKSTIEDFNLGTQLIVHESQEAIFFANGQALDLFGAGRYTLDTQNLPLLSSKFNKATGGKNAFHCEVYFINKTHQLAIKWGTDSQVQYMEPTYKFPLQIGASGEMVISVDNSRKLLVKLVGTEKTLTQDKITQLFRSFLMSKIKPYIAQTMQNASFTIFEVDSYMGELSGSLQELLSPDFSDYGLNLERFMVTNIAKPDGETAYENFKDLHIRSYSDVAEATLKQKVGVIEQQTLAQQQVIEAEALAKKRQLEGYTYKEERGFDVAEKMAENEAVGEFANMGIGLGIMGGVATPIGNAVGGAVGNAVTPQATDDLADFKKKIEKLTLLKESGIITEEEFSEMKKELLKNL